MQFATLSRCFDPGDYELLESEIGHLEYARGLIRNYRFEHPHRMWEYAMFLRATLESPQGYSVLDVGGGGSLLAPTLSIIHPFTVTVVDPQPVGGMISEQAKAINTMILFAQGDFMSYTGGVYDFVSCISVIEHVHNDIAFFEKLLRHVRGKGILFLTTDFHESGKPQTIHHLRTYNEKSLKALLDIATLEGFKPLLGDPNWSSRGNHINGYNFCSMAVSRIR